MAVKKTRKLPGRFSAVFMFITEHLQQLKGIQCTKLVFERVTISQLIKVRERGIVSVKSGI